MPLVHAADKLWIRLPVRRLLRSFEMQYIAGSYELAGSFVFPTGTLRELLWVGLIWISLRIHVSSI